MRQEDRIILECADAEYEQAYEAYEQLIKLRKGLDKASSLNIESGRFITKVDELIKRKVGELERILEVIGYIQQKNNIQEEK